MLKSVPNSGINIPDHTIIDKIGDGGMASVYLARQQSLQRKVAIKILRTLVMENPNLAERFIDEAKTIALLDHPNIISIYEVKKLPSGLAYFTMPYLNNGNFSEIICTNAKHLIYLLTQICDGLAHAHKHGVIHRDLKPDNILFDQFNNLKIADFGIALSKRSKRKTKEKQIVGSAHYMSPEQVQSLPIDHRTDIYSLGCIIYEKLTGETLFKDENDFSILMSHLNQQAPQLPKPLKAWQPIIDKCLTKLPENRFQTALEVKVALALLQDEGQDTPLIPSKTDTISNSSAFKYASIAALVILVLVAGSLIFFTSSSVNFDSQIIEQPVLATTPPLLESEPADPSDLIPEEPTKGLEIEEITTEIGDPLIFATVDTEDQETAADGTAIIEDIPFTDEQVQIFMIQGNELLGKYRLTRPRGESAADKFKIILHQRPNHPGALDGLNRVGTHYLKLIERKISEKDFIKAAQYSASLNEFWHQNKLKRSLFEKHVSKIITQTNLAVLDAQKSRRISDEANQLLLISQTLMPDNPLLKQFAQILKDIPKTGQPFADPNGLDGVFIRSDILSKYQLTDFIVTTAEVTVSQYQTYAANKAIPNKCHHYGKKVFFKKTWKKPPFKQSGDHPVVCVSADDAARYAKWLSAKTGYTYRLPSMNQWLYLNEISQLKTNCQTANLAGTETASEKKLKASRLSCNDHSVFTSAVKQHKKSQYNLYGINGNVSEWVRNCPTDSVCNNFKAIGSSWQTGNNILNNNTQNANSAETYSHIGFRLVREL
ncbi:MAG: bifunctional serine/threonine-protein kinase/formylglycine-generating enzyme family protein [Proteobacteria bacterium]|nr:bifunctional serine/threonine-protein kinase/formylglycine-generating enzyme family protein [Pseudomonadota bacterium]